MKKKNEMHPIKQVSKKLGLTYKELGEAIGYSEGSLRQSVYDNKISPQLKKALELYLKIIELEKKVNEMEEFRKTLANFILKSQ